MSRERVKWGEVERELTRRGFTIYSKGGEKIIQGPLTTGGDRSRNQILIGHTSCNRAGTELLPVYVSKICRVCSLTIDDLKGRRRP